MQPHAEKASRSRERRAVQPACCLGQADTSMLARKGGKQGSQIGCHGKWYDYRPAFFFCVCGVIKSPWNLTIQDFTLLASAG